MNIDVATRLYELRKKSGLSQEELADKLGISRQSVSKWERAEASPDTDNLILLAQLYGVSLDDLLLGGKADPKAEDQASTDSSADSDDPSDSDTVWQEGPAGKTNDHVHISFKNGIHVETEDESVHISFKDGIHVDEHGKGGSKVDVGEEGVWVNGKRVDTKQYGCNYKRSLWYTLPMPILAVIAFVLWGCLVPGGWSVSWLVLLLIPLYYSLLEAIRHRNAKHFAFPVLAAGAYVGVGLFTGIWHPTWVIFLAIPVFYWVASAVRKETGHCDDDDD